MEFVAENIQVFHFVVGYFYTGRIGLLIQHGAHGQTGFGGGMVDKFQIEEIG